MLAPSMEVGRMPVESLIVSVCIVAVFVVFGAVLIWGDRQTRSRQLTQQSTAKRRAF
jgi:hypothetical protein